MGTLQIARPCHEDWDRMTPSPGGRTCDACRLEVVDVSASAPGDRRARLRELHQRLAQRPLERLCVRGESDGRGRILSPAHRRLLTDAFACMLAMTIAGCAGSGPALDGAHGEPTSAPVTQGARTPGAGGTAGTHAGSVEPAHAQPPAPVSPGNGYDGRIMGEATVPEPAHAQALTPRPVMGVICVPQGATPPPAPVRPVSQSTTG
jgi:hypothetical protein